MALTKEQVRGLARIKRINRDWAAVLALIIRSRA
jgi:hypothetical protein